MVFCACSDGDQIACSCCQARLLGTAMTGIGNIYSDRDGHEQALAAYQNAYRVRLTHLGPYHPDTAGFVRCALSMCWEWKRDIQRCVTESLCGIGHCLTQLNKISEAVEQLKVKVHVGVGRCDSRW
jgi:hypothetical protein